MKHAVNHDSQTLGPLMLDVKGLVLTDNEKKILGSSVVGGLILFSRNYESPSQLCKLIEEIRLVSPNIIIAVDHEGGRVQRFKAGFTRIPAMATLGELYKNNPKLALELSRDCGWLMAAELVAFDIDISFVAAPLFTLDEKIAISKKSSCTKYLKHFDEKIQELHDDDFIYEQFDEFTQEWNVMEYLNTAN